MAPLIQVQNVSHTYNAESERPVHALRNINLTINQGEYVVILGHNGSGKSTLARHLNGLLLPTTGDVLVQAWNTKEGQHLRAIRSTVGMVFQTPDNQIVATIVEEDVAFGPENLGIPHDEMVQRVNWSLEQVGMSAFRHRAPHLLSGGQKQRICIAGVLAMQPAVLVLDESTAMLDPLGRQEVLAVAHRLNRAEGTTVVAITHFMQEAVDADRVIVMAEGQVVLEGTPRELFRQVARLRELHLDIPPATEVALALHERFPDFPADVLSVEELVDAVQQRVPKHTTEKMHLGQTSERPETQDATHEPLITIEHLIHDYMRGTPLQVRALHDVNLTVRTGEIVGVIGHTGSGKSTAIQHMNALLQPHGGSVVILGHDMADRKVDIQEVRRRVGLVFQFPEAQLFERYVGDDIAYGPRNLKLSREATRERVRRAMTAVGLGFEEFKDRMTFALSGGQMRRVALAGVLALEPEVLVLDEPTAGLDPAGRAQLMAHILALHQQGTTLVMISHNMDELATICDRLTVLADGRTVLEGTPAAIFAQADYLQSLGLDVPVPTRLFAALQARGIASSDETVYTLPQAIKRLTALLTDQGPMSTNSDANEGAMKDEE
jgi:energy-coupling factor transport system ATP-binding protein